MPTALITGASSGIGKAIYGGLKTKGFHCMGLSRRGPDIKVDVRDITDATQIWSGTGLDLLVNCAGIMPFDETPEVMDTNFWGTVKMIHNVFGSMSKGGCIINIASVSGVRPDAQFPIYSASKAAIIALTKSLALRLAKVPIRVNCISPGFYKTNLVEGDTPADLLYSIPLKYEEKPINLVDLVELIYTTKYMTGSNIVVDGGVSL